MTDHVTFRYFGDQVIQEHMILGRRQVTYQEIGQLYDQVTTDM